MSIPTPALLLGGIPQSIPDGAESSSASPESTPQGIPASAETSAVTPVSIPDSNPPSPPKDRRGTLTFKGEGFDREFRALINKAAERSGQTQAAFVEHSLRHAAQQVLKGSPANTPLATPPVAAAATTEPDRIERALIELTETMQRLAAHTLATQEATREPRRSRLWDLFWGGNRGAERGAA